MQWTERDKTEVPFFGKTLFLDTVYPVKNKVWIIENTVGFNPEWWRGQVGHYCINCRIVL